MGAHQKAKGREPFHGAPIVRKEFYSHFCRVSLRAPFIKKIFTKVSKPLFKETLQRRGHRRWKPNFCRLLYPPFPREMWFTPEFRPVFVSRAVIKQMLTSEKALVPFKTHDSDKRCLQHCVPHKDCMDEDVRIHTRWQLMNSSLQNSKYRV